MSANADEKYSDREIVFQKKALKFGKNNNVRAKTRQLERGYLSRNVKVDGTQNPRTNVSDTIEIKDQQVMSSYLLFSGSFRQKPHRLHYHCI